MSNILSASSKTKNVTRSRFVVLSLMWSISRPLKKITRPNVVLAGNCQRKYWDTAIVQIQDQGFKTMTMHDNFKFNKVVNMVWNHLGLKALCTTQESLSSFYSSSVAPYNL